jgi:uncharacterized protein YndB with AHSA1/START domain
VTGFGTITGQGTTRTIRFERVLAHSPTDVWAALTEPDRLSDWLALAEVEPGEGGSMTLDFGDGGIERCRITVWDPPRLLAYDWKFVGEMPSQVSWELSALDGGSATRLTLEHTLLDAAVAPAYGAGWHAHLDQLAGHLDGDAGPWQERFDAVLERYRDAAAPAA